MPKVTVSFTIAYTHGKTRAAGNVELGDAAAFLRIADLGFGDRSKFGVSVMCLKVEALEGDPRINEIFRILAEHGIRPTDRTNPPPGRQESEFRVYREREYSAKEIRAAEYLRLRPRFGQNPIADLAIPRNARVVGLEWRELSRRSVGNDGEGWRVFANARLRKQMEYGYLNSIALSLVGPKLKPLLEAENLRGLSFIPVRYDKPEKAARQLWQFGHALKMPPCLLPRQGQDSTDCTSNEVDGAIWEDHGYRPEELRFRRSEVEAMGPFDIATTQEQIGANETFMHAEVIVSQRFRETMERLKIRVVEYAPVRLV